MSAMKEFNGTNYLTLTKHSTINAVNKLTLNRQDDVPDNKQQMKLPFPPDGVHYAQCCLSCNMCQDTSRVIDSDRKISKCSECGLMQQNSQCSTQVMTSILTITDEETMSFNIFDDIIKRTRC